MSGARVTRRSFLAAGAVGLTALRARGEVAAEVKVVLNYDRGLWYYDPVGVYIQPGETVQWQALRWTPSVTAFHPDNGNRELRIPEGARPFDSGMLATLQTWEWKFDLEGTYDYFSRYHEGVGLIGRVVVGAPGGPGERPPGYGGAEGRAPVDRLGRRLFEILDSRQIVEQKRVPFPVDRMARGRLWRKRYTRDPLPQK